MDTLFVAASSSRGVFKLIRRALEGDMDAVLTIVAIVVAVALIFYLQKIWVRSRGSRLAEQLGGESRFDPQPPGEDRVWSIESHQYGLDYQVEAIKYGKQYVTALVFSLPVGMSWKDIVPFLKRSGEKLEAAEVDDFPGEITLRFPGLGGDPEFIKGLFGEISDGIKAMRA